MIDFFTPYRIGAVAVAVLVLVFAGLTVNGWRQDSHALEAAQKALKAEIGCEDGTHCRRERLKAREQALTEAERTLRAEQKLNQERENDYQERLAEVDRNYRDAADRLSRIRVCKPVPQRPATAPVAGEPVPAGPIDTGDGESVAGLGPILRDCEADAAQLTEAQLWYAELRSIRNAEIEHGRQP